MKYNGKKIQSVCNKLAVTCMAITGYAGIAGKQSGTPGIILFLGWTIIGLFIFALGFILRRFPIIARKYRNKAVVRNERGNTSINPSEQIDPLKAKFPVGGAQGTDNDSIISLKSFLIANHDFSTGKGPEIRDWALGGHSMFLHKGDQTVQVNSPKNDPSKLSVPFVASTLAKNMDKLVVCKAKDEQGEDYYILMDKAAVTADTQTTTGVPKTQEDLTREYNEQKGKIIENGTLSGSNETVRFCRYCGRNISEDSKYCPYCGRNQHIHNTFFQTHNLVSIIQLFWNIIKELRGRFVMPKNDSITFACIKKWIKRIIIVLISTATTGLLVFLGFWLYGFYQVSQWTREDRHREAIAMNDISKADSIARKLFQEHANGSHRYDFDGTNCNFFHINKGIEIVRYAAEKGNADAQFTLGCIYAGAHYEWKEPAYSDKYTMLYTDIEKDRAVYWYSLAAKQGHRDALNNLGNAYRFGNGVLQSLIKATEFLQKAAELGCPNAQLSIGDMYRDGDIWYAANDSVAENTIYINAKPNLEKAKEWWSKAADQGLPIAKERLEKIYDYVPIMADEFMYTENSTLTENRY